MAETATTTRITERTTVIVPVGDQERSLEFYVGTLGFEKVADFRYADGERWVEVAPAGATMQIALVVRRVDEPAAIETRVAFAAEDIEAAHADLGARGVDVGPILREGGPAVRWGGATLAGVPAMFLVRDPDGNSLLLVQGA